jgi:hypothetical protein
MASAWLNISNSRPCAIATSLNPQAPAVLTASAVGAQTAMRIDEAETPQDRQACSTPGALMVSPATGSVGYFFRSGLRGRARRRRPSAGNSPIASTVSNAESSAPTRSCKPAIGERMISGSAGPRSDYRSERLLGVPKECKRTIEFAGGGLRIGQLKLQTGDPSNSGLLPATPGR